MDCEPEEWRRIAGWPHEVSSLGRVRRAEPAPGVKVGHVLSQMVDRAGYRRVSLRRNCQRPKKFMVHCLVAEAFLEDRPTEEHTVNHKNGDKADNRPENLEWATRSENQVHAYETGLQGRGEKHGRAKLTEADVLDIRKRYAAGGCTQTALAREYGVNQTLIGFVVRRVVWTHLE